MRYENLRKLLFLSFWLCSVFRKQDGKLEIKLKYPHSSSTWIYLLPSFHLQASRAYNNMDGNKWQDDKFWDLCSTHYSNPQQSKINGSYYAIDGMVQLQVSSSNIIETSWDNSESSEGRAWYSPLTSTPRHGPLLSSLCFNWGEGWGVSVAFRW